MKPNRGLFQKFQQFNKMVKKVFDAWICECNKITEDQCPHDILLTDDPERLSHWLGFFCIEVRKEDGTHYTPLVWIAEANA